MTDPESQNNPIEAKATVSHERAIFSVYPSHIWSMGAALAAIIGGAFSLGILSHQIMVQKDAVETQQQLYAKDTQIAKLTEENAQLLKERRARDSARDRRAARNNPDIAQYKSELSVIDNVLAYVRDHSDVSKQGATDAICSLS